MLLLLLPALVQELVQQHPRLLVVLKAPCWLNMRVLGRQLAPSVERQMQGRACEAPVWRRGPMPTWQGHQAVRRPLAPAQALAH